MPNAPYKVKALYEYASEHADDLTFQPGQHIIVEAVEDEEWLRGSYEDDHGVQHKGIFPKNFVQEVRRAPAPPSVSSSQPAQAHALVEEAEKPLSSTDPGKDSAQSASISTNTRDEEETPDMAASSTKDLEVPFAASEVKAEEPVPGPVPLSSAHASAGTSVAPISIPASSSISPREPASAKSPPTPSVKSSSFRDRIAAFNNPTAAPVAPKPMAKPSLARKPFVAPPPAKDSYVAPAGAAPKPTSQAARISEDQSTTPVPAARANDTVAKDVDVQPTMSLKERIAALQREREQDAAKTTERIQSPTADDGERPTPVFEDEGRRSLSRTTTARSDMLSEQKTGGSVVSQQQSLPPQVPAPIVQQVAQAEEDTSSPISRTDSISRHRTVPDTESINEETVDQRELSKETSASQADASEEPELEQELDPEETRKQQLRARMAKMSGMGMGMHMALGIGGGGPRPPKPKSLQKQSPHVDDVESSQAHQSADLPRAVPMPGLPAAAAPPPAIVGGGHPPGDDVDEVQPGDAEEGLSELGSSVLHSPATSARSPILPPHKRQDSIRSIRSIHQTINEEDENLARPAPPLASPPLVTPHSPRPNASTISYFPSSPTTTPRSPLATAIPPPVPGAARPPAPPVPAIRPSDIDDGEDEEDDADDEANAMLASPSAPAASSARAPAPSVPPQARTAPAVPSSSRPPVPNSQNLVQSEDDSDSPRGSAGQPMVHPAAQILRQESTVHSGASESEGEGYAADDDTDAASVLDTKRQSTIEPLSPTERSNLPPLPRTAPPPPRNVPPQPSALTRPPVGLEQSDETARDTHEDTTTPDADSDEDSSAPNLVPAPVPISAPASATPPVVPISEEPRRSLARQSTDRNRRSMDPAHGVGGFAARDIDMSPQTGWFQQPNMPPPSLQGRTDLSYEIDESTKTSRGTTVITKEIYVLYADLSQSLITCTFSTRADSGPPQFDQSHTPPPQNTSRDDLERAYSQYGARVLSTAKSKEGQSLGAGADASALVWECVRALDNALTPIGTRTYGATVYQNIANAHVSAVDEIRPGDILAFRNAKLQGHKGAIKSKYSVEVGKPDHAAVVLDWDGSKKKIRVLEVDTGVAPTPNKPAKIVQNSYKLNDLKSGEAKVFRIVGRDFVGWQS
ncbi:assembly of actin patch protein [Savitreella phatthalungensis]